jgi:DNA replication initiation complex subunit (GINS family)
LLNYSELRDIQKREMESSGIVKLSDDFYQSVALLLTCKKQEAISSKSLMAIKEYENIKKILVSIQSKREEKIVLMAVRGDSSDGGLTAEEKGMLREIRSTVDKSHESIKGVWENDDIAPSNSKKIKILQDVAQYKGLDNMVYGPYKKGDEQVVPHTEAEWLLKSRMAELL